MTRRTLLASSVAFALPAFSDTRLPIHRAVEYEMLPEGASIPERFQIARDAGFERVECPTTADQKQAEEMKSSAEKAGLKIHSVMNMGHWKYPLSSADPAVVEKSLDIARISIRNAHLWGADTVLIVPAVVDPQTSYRDAYTRSQAAIRKLLPLAEELHVIIAVEEVWNKFLLSPLEFAKYVDEFQSPWLRAYFDVGNVKLYGYPQDWIRTLGPRIAKLHIKDFSWRKAPGVDGNIAEFVPLLEGDIDWRAVYEALRDIHYQGTATVELPSGDPAYLKEVNRRFTEILNGTAKPIKRS
ncbi:MAG TPA: sugar phosphate isomerase/epimerase family protein [Bryobacteraceae bacterium]|jgi:hexulose-6-phosphate isomerase|nr:sugar phosphate isomerase/epimerase family protein [Bryobacteraceae bacterium]